MDNIYCIFDSLAGEAGPVFTARNDAVALRAFRMDLQEQIKVDMSAYHLFRVACFNPETMVVEAVVNPVEVFIEVKQGDMLEEDGK